MKKFIMAVGLPLSGKSTAAEQYKKEGYTVISRDEILQQILEHPDFIAYKQEVINHLPQPVPRNLEWNITSELATQELAAQVAAQVIETPGNFFYDGTNLKKDTRAPLLAELKDHASIEALVFPITRETLLQRAHQARENNTRQGFHAQSLNDGDLELMMKWYEPPTESEGFITITEYIPPQENKELIREFKIPLK